MTNHGDTRPPACERVQAHLNAGTNACAFRDEVEAFALACAAPPARTAALELAYLKLIFDREVMLIFRLYPVAEHHADWASFNQKWQARLAALPAVVALDDSTDIEVGERHALQKRLARIADLERAAAANEAKYTARLGRAHGPEFFLLGAALMIQAGKAKAAKSALLFDSAFAAGRADHQLELERDLFNTMYPEFLAGLPAHAVAMRYQIQNDLYPNERLAELVFASQPEGHIAPVDQRFELMLRRLNANVGDLSDLAAAFRVRMAEVRQKLDDDVARVLEQPDLLLKDGLVTTGAMTQLGPSAFQLRQSLQVAQCTTIYRDREWAYVAGLSEHYGGYVFDALMVASLAGGRSAFAGRWALGRGLAVPLWRGLLARGVLLGARIGDVTGTALVVGGPPWSGFNFSYHVARYAKVSREYYETVALDERARYRLDAASPSALDAEASARWWSAFNAILNLAPLAFLR